jgi:transposase
MAKRHNYSAEFKRDAVRMVMAGTKTRAQIARELGVRADLLCKWQAALDPKSRATGNDVSDSERVKQLEREVAILKEERDILKKATAFFAKEQR